MAKPRPDEVQKELEEQDDDVYGTGYTDGDPDKFADTEEMVKDVTGNDPDPERDGFEIEEEVEDDEKSIRDDEPEDKAQDEIDEIESAIEKVEKEKRDKDSSDED
jgi:hypothetical protein